MSAWHCQSVGDALSYARTTAEGLSADEASRRLSELGRNVIPTTAGKSPLQRFIEQFNNLLIYVLLGAAVVTALLGHVIDTGVILAVVVVNAVIGFVQEGKAEAALEAIRGMISPKASVLRDGARATIDACDVVPGDILLLEAGDRVTADVRLVKARNLRIDEAILTGESVPVEKGTEPVAAEAALGDRRSIAFSGTLVTAGQGAGVVVATGGNTELGRISALIGRVEQLETPLIRQMNEFARHLTWAILALSVAMLAFAVLVRGYPAAEAFMAVVGMAVAAIPEGLPAVMTITLAIGVQRMATRNAIIRRLPAVETLGSVSTICSDKTGTLTRNEMTVTRVVLTDRTYDVGGVGYAPKGGFSIGDREIDGQTDRRLLEIGKLALLCNDASIRSVGGDYAVDGDPMEGALVTLGLKTGHDRTQLMKEHPRLDEIPFDAAHRYMATLHRSHDGAVRGYVKGAPERIFDMCTCEATSEGESPIARDRWHEAVDTLAREGRRVLALAYRTFPPDKHALSFGDVDQGLTLIGLVGLIDPPRPEAIAAIHECRAAGIAVKMITGDHAATASAIARELGLDAPERVLTGQDLDTLDESGFRDAVRSTSVFARTSPELKLRLVEAMQADHAVIAMTGDGVNDAPALKRADVGVAMGKSGTEAAKEASDMVLADDNFASIVAAAREGRTVYDNLTKVIGWTLPTNGGETLIVVAAILFGLTLPITPVQILWINMVTAVGLGLVLAFEPAEPGVMSRPPRAPDAPILSRFLLWRVVFVSVLFAFGAFGVFYWAEARSLSHETARTMVVNTIVVMEIFYLFSVRYLRGTSVTWQGMLGTPAVLSGVAAIVALQLAFTYLPFMQRLFQTRAVAVGDGIVIIAIGIVLLLVLELDKVLARLWRNAGLTRRQGARSIAV
ncbi:MAG: cation-transporting P-type ATPase [Pseudomonadota bacterium]